MYLIMLVPGCLLPIYRRWLIIKFLNKISFTYQYIYIFPKAAVQTKKKTALERILGFQTVFQGKD